MLGTLLGSIVHEFNNILTPVMSYAEMALESPQDAALSRKAVERAYHGCDRAAKISAAILAFAGDGARKADGAGDGALVSEVVRDALLCLAFDPAKYGVTVTTEIAPECRAAMDPVSLQQVLLNLVLNAFKAMKSRGGRLTVRAGPGPRSTWNITPSRSSGFVTLEVEDTGCGIEPDRLRAVFDAFVSRGPAKSDEPAAFRSGTGLGLTICKQLVEAAGGEIAVESRVSAGTRFTIRLPAAVRASHGALRASA